MFLTKCGLKIGLTNFFKVGIHQKNIQNWFIDLLRANYIFENGINII